MSPALSMTIMMSNYFHDVATALLAASGIALWVLIRSHEAGDPATDAYFSRVHGGLKSLARFSLFWILAGGIPRTIYFRSFEWANAVQHHQIPALIAKHVLAFVLVALGAYLWGRFNAMAAAIAAGGAAATANQ